MHAGQACYHQVIIPALYLMCSCLLDIVMFTKMNFCYYVFPIVLWGHALAQSISVSYCPLRTEKKCVFSMHNLYG